MLPRPGSESIFRIFADVGLLSALEREPFLLVGFRLLRDDSVLLQYGPVSRPLVLLPEEERVERDLVRRDADDAKRVEEHPALRAVLLDEDVVGSSPPERFAWVAVEGCE